MWNDPTKEQLARIPRLYVTEDIPPGEKLIFLHFFLGGSDWYIAEFDGEDTFFGYAVLNGDTEMAEWGYVSFRELRELNLPYRAYGEDHACSGHRLDGSGEGRMGQQQHADVFA